MVHCPSGCLRPITACDKCIECLDIDKEYVACHGDWMLNERGK